MIFEFIKWTHIHVTIIFMTVVVIIYTASPSNLHKFMKWLEDMYYESEKEYQEEIKRKKDKKK